MRIEIALGVGAVLAVLGTGTSVRAAESGPKISFEKQILPIFQDHCVSCHGPGGVGYISSSMDLRSYEGLKMGSVGGIAVIPFHADRSPLLRYLDANWHSNDKNALKMPPLGPELSPTDLKLITDWINQGAKNN